MKEHLDLCSGGEFCVLDDCLCECHIIPGGLSRTCPACGNDRSHDWWTVGDDSYACDLSAAEPSGEPARPWCTYSEPHSGHRTDGGTWCNGAEPSGERERPANCDRCEWCELEGCNRHEKAAPVPEPSGERDGLIRAVESVRMPHRQGDLHNYGWNDAVEACVRAIKAYR